MTKHDELDKKLPPDINEDDDEAPRKSKAAPGRTPHPRGPDANKPNVPCFAWKRGPGGKLTPDLEPGEKILAEGTAAGGVPTVITSGGRKIFLCTIADYENKVAPLSRRALWEAWYPHAAV